MDAEPETASDGDDELVLGAETIVADTPAPAAPVTPAAPVANAPVAAAPSAPLPRPTFSDDAVAQTAAVPPADGNRRRWLAPGSEAAEPVAAPAPRVKLGGTLFERMSNAARGAPRDEAEGDEPPALDIPRFLHRQNNQ